MRLTTAIVLSVVAAGAGFALSRVMDRPPAVATPAAGTKPDPRGPAPRDASGKPDLSGIWQAESMPREEAIKFAPDGVDGAQTLGEDVPARHFLNVMWNLKPDEVALLPESARLFQERAASSGRDVPSSFCIPLGIPFMDAALYPRKIVQTPGVVAILYEELTVYRQIFTDGRALKADPEPAFLGHSVGRWDGDELVVEANGFRDNGWLDGFGHPHSSAMRLTERFHRRDFGSMEVTVTVDDPKTYSKPFTYSFIQTLRPESELIESICENEKDRARLNALR